ncbi:hypothetical protein JCM3765_007359 [Sporobolomyces pararoseus]
MNSLPPELLSSIIESAVECSSLYDSYKARIKTLSALTLVNRQFHEIAQPLLPQKVYFRHRWEEAAFSKGRSTGEVFDLVADLPNHGLVYQSLGDFARLRELRIVACGGVPLWRLSDHNHLKRLSFEHCGLIMDVPDHSFVLPHLEQLSFERVHGFVHSESGLLAPFFSTSTFPSLRALGIKALDSSAPPGAHTHRGVGLFSPSLLAQLDCITTDEIEPRGDPTHSLSPPPLPVPVLFDVDPRRTSTSWGRSSLAPDSSLSQTHLRIRLSCEPLPHRRQIEAALFLVETLLNETKVLEELYLDLYPRDGRRYYVLDEELQERIRKLEDPNRKTKVEIIWENHEDDWCRSRVSKEFWRRSKAKKQKAEQEKGM